MAAGRCPHRSDQSYMLHLSVCTCYFCNFLSAGFHLEGPFISVEKKGAHPERYLRTFNSGGIEDVMVAYGSLDNVAMVTLAPELSNSQSVVKELCQRGITVSLGKHRNPLIAL